MNGNVQPYNIFASEGGCLMEASSVSQPCKRRAGVVLWGGLVLALLVALCVALPALGAGPQDRVRATINAVSAILGIPRSREPTKMRNDGSG